MFYALVRITGEDEGQGKGRDFPSARGDHLFQSSPTLLMTPEAAGELLCWEMWRHIWL